MIEDINSFSSDWSENYRIKFKHLAPGGKADFTELIGFTQDTAWEHAESLGVGHSNLEEEKLIFALCWESITLYDKPRYGDRIEVHTSLAGMSRLYFYRDFVVTDEDSEVLLEARTTWVCLDIDSRRPQRLDGLTRKFDFPSLEKPSERKKPDLSPPDKGWQGYSASVLPSDLDAYYHANNIQYVRWMLDGLPLEFLSSHDLANFDIEYQGELHCGNQLQIEANKKDTTVFHRIIKKEDQSEVALARSTWSPR